MQSIGVLSEGIVGQRPGGQLLGALAVPLADSLRSEALIDFSAQTCKLRPLHLEFCSFTTEIVVIGSAIIFATCKWPSFAYAVCMAGRGPGEGAENCSHGAALAPVLQFVHMQKVNSRSTSETRGSRRKGESRNTGLTRR